MMEDNAPVISVKHVSKSFKLPHERKNTLKEHILNFRQSAYEEFKALEDVNFEVKKGEFLGIVGRNGSGKSTLLKILSGIYQPTKGEVKVEGTLTPFIELGIGFNPELTGQENVFLNGAILGLTRKQIIQMYDSIVEFAELEKFMGQKLKNYSSGMQVRLAFSIAIQAHNDILLIDEVLAVGDANFQKKCFDVFKDIKKSGKTVIFVTHDMGAVQEYCDRAIMLQDGKVLIEGKPREVTLHYELANSSAVSEGQAAGIDRPKDPDIRIADVKLTKQGKPSRHFSVDDDITAEVTLEGVRPREIQVNLFIINSTGDYLGGINTNKHLENLIPQKGKQTIKCVIKAGQLVHGEYKVGVGVYTPGYIAELIDVIDQGYTSKLPLLTIVDRSFYQDGQFYIQGQWSKK